jgi:hypothetical protein
VPGFLTPGVLYISSGVSSEFKVLKPAFGKALEAGYTRFIEPACGAFAMAHVARQAGWEGIQMEASDVILMSAVMGYTVMGKPLDDLDIRIKGFEHEDMTDAATVIWAQALSRAASRSQTLYWAEITHSMKDERAQHIGRIQAQLDRAATILRGLKYETMDMFQHLQRVMDDPNAFVMLNPPSTKAGFEQFFETGGIVTWNAPVYELFDPVAGYAKLGEWMKDAKGLWMVYEENQGGHVIEGAIMARGAGRKGPDDHGIARSINYYIVSNRPDEARELLGGLIVIPWQGVRLEKPNRPFLPEAHPITADTRIEVAPMPQAQATYVRALWQHNFVGSSSSLNLALYLDGYIAGVFGYDPSWMSSLGRFGGDSDACLVQYGMTVPQKRLRFNRLLGMIALCRESLGLVLNDVEMYRVAKVVTAQLTKHPETKEYRGVMRLRERKTDPQFGYRLIYEQEVSDLTWPETLAGWLKGEEKYMKARAQAVGAG